MKPTSITALQIFFFIATVHPVAASIDRHEKVFSVTWLSRLHPYRSSRENTSHRRCPPTEMQELSEAFGNDVRWH